MEKKHIIIALLIILAAILCCAILFSSGTTHEKTYQSYNFSATCSIELPTWISFNNGAGDLNSSSNVMGSNVASTTKALFGNNEVMQITYSHSTVDGANVGANLNDNMVLDQNGKKVYTRTVMSEETGESISVMGENEEVVNYIADHVKFNGKGANKTANQTTEDTTSNEEPVTTNTTNDDGKPHQNSPSDMGYSTDPDLAARERAYNQGFNDALSYQQDDYMDDDAPDEGEVRGSSSSDSSSSSVETTTG